jgi:hypothetical protein
MLIWLRPEFLLAPNASPTRKQCKTEKVTKNTVAPRSSRQRGMSTKKNKFIKEAIEKTT